MSNRPVTTLFMLSSVDGKISTGFLEERDTDKDFPKVIGLAEGLQQYYDYEQTTDLHSLGSGKTFAKTGINDAKEIQKTPVSFIVIDNTHLTLKGVENLIKKSEKLYLVTTNPAHPAFSIKSKSLIVLYYKNSIPFPEMFKTLKQEYEIDAVTIQTGGTLNALFLRSGLIDYLSLFIAPALIGGKNTPTLEDGLSLTTEEDLKDIKTLELLEMHRLHDSYIHLKYKVKN